jgi:hypothetical protein
MPPRWPLHTLAKYLVGVGIVADAPDDHAEEMVHQARSFHLKVSPPRLAPKCHESGHLSSIDPPTRLNHNESQGRLRPRYAHCAGSAVPSLATVRMNETRFKQSICPQFRTLIFLSQPRIPTDHPIDRLSDTVSLPFVTRANRAQCREQHWRRRIQCPRSLKLLVLCGSMILRDY